jgi:integrase
MTERLPRGIRRLPNGTYRVRKGRQDLRAQTPEKAYAIFARLNARDAGAARVSSATLAEFLPRYLDSRTLSIATRRRYENDLAAYIRGWPIGRIRITNLTPEDLLGHWRALAGYTGGVSGRPLSPNTIGQVRRLLNGALKWAVERRYIALNPVPLAPGPKGRKVSRIPPTAEQVERILAELAGNRYELGYLIAARTGMRQGEVFGLVWACIDLEADPPIIRVERSLSAGFLSDTKTPGSLRELAITPELADRLRAYRAQDPNPNPTGLLFGTRNGRPIDPSAILRTYKRAVRRSGVAAEREAANRHPLTFHDLRHAFATHAAAGGVPVELLSKYLGHSSISITADRYYHPTAEDLGRVAQAHAAYIGRRLNGANEGNSAPIVTGWPVSNSGHSR